MGQYMRKKKGVSDTDAEHPYFSAIQDCVSDAWAVREFLDAQSAS
jgi:hypothetical protein